MKAIFYYFSGTGNTLKICRLFAEELQKRGFSCDFYEINAQNEQKLDIPENYDRAVIAYPVHGFNAPEPVLGFARGLPEAHGKSIYIIKTSGEPLALNSASSCVLADILSDKNYVVCGEYHYVMPYNIIFRHTDGMVSRMWRAALNAAPRDCEEIALGVRREFRLKTKYKAVSKLFGIEHPAIKRIGKGFKIEGSKCVNCYKCKKGCPAANIGVRNGKITFGNACVGCMRCVFTCPANAINAGILNRWKVNGGYSFGLLDDEGEICGYCKKSYEKYFSDRMPIKPENASEDERLICAENLTSPKKNDNIALCLWDR